MFSFTFELFTFALAIYFIWTFSCFFIRFVHFFFRFTLAPAPISLCSPFLFFQFSFFNTSKKFNGNFSLLNFVVEVAFVTHEMWMWAPLLKSERVEWVLKWRQASKTMKEKKICLHVRKSNINIRYSLLVKRRRC